MPEDDSWFQPAFVRNALEHLPVSVVITDETGRIIHSNNAFEQLTEFTFGEIAGKNCRFLQSPNSDKATVARIHAALEAGRAFRGELLNRRKGGSEFWNSLMITPIRDERGRLRSFASVQMDVTDQVTARTTSALQNVTAEVLLGTASRLAAANTAGDVGQALANGVVGAGAERSIVILADEYGTTPIVRASPWDDVGGIIDVARALASKRNFFDSAIRRRRGVTDRHDADDRLGALMAQWHIERLILEPVIAGRGVQGVIAACWSGTPDETIDDIVLDRIARLAELGAVSFENVALISQIRAAASEDELTRVHSRASIRTLLETSLASGRQVGVLYVDVDRFKRLNDSLGHAGGDQLLVQIAARLRQAIGMNGVIGRPGGDEFVVVMQPPLTTEPVADLSARIERSMRGGFEVLGRSVYATVSVGGVVDTPRPSESSAAAADRMLRDADHAMYDAKERKRTRRRTDTHLDVIAIESDLYEAVRQHRISTMFQPIFNARTNRLAGFEALARWQHDDLGDIPPDVFIPLAEEDGLIDQLGEQLLRDAFAFIENASDRGPLHLHLNISAHQLTDPSFLPHLRGMLDEYRDRSWALTAEITESDLATDEIRIGSSLRQLRELDVEVTIDSFGSGFTSLRLLQDLPITAIKIDKAFVRRTGALGSGMVAAVVSLARGLGLDVMAEGVETGEQLAALQRLGCDRVQGFLLAPPLQVADALRSPPTISDAIRH